MHPFEKWQRGGLIALAALQTVVSVWQYLFPRSFFDDFPTVRLDPPFNEHLVSDVGGLGLALCVMMVAAAVLVRDNAVVLTVTSGYLVYAATHFTFHVTHFDNFSVGDALAVGTGLGVEVVLASLLLHVSWLRHRHRHPSRPGVSVPRG